MCSGFVVLLHNPGKEKKRELARAAGGAKSLAVDETRLPRTTRHLFQCFDVDVMQFDASLSDFVDRVGGIDGGVFHSLNTQSVRRTELKSEGHPPQ